jgi:peptide/nickel transport system substrate-binding protein
VKNVQAVGRYTIVITLRRPNAAALLDLGGVGVWEKTFQDEHKTTFGEPGTLLIGTGPWKVDSLEPTSGMQLSVNPHWWGGNVNVKRISVEFFNNETSMTLAFRAGEIDVTGSRRSETLAGSRRHAAANW